MAANKLIIAWEIFQPLLVHGTTLRAPVEIIKYWFSKAPLDQSLFDMQQNLSAWPSNYREKLGTNLEQHLTQLFPRTMHHFRPLMPTVTVCYHVGALRKGWMNSHLCTWWRLNDFDSALTVLRRRNPRVLGMDGNLHVPASRRPRAVMARRVMLSFGLVYSLYDVKTG